jgi:predicted dehydrogenase
MNDFTRREFMATSAGISVAATAAAAQDAVVGANERVQVGLIGCGGQGTHHLNLLMRNAGVRVVGVSDVYKPRLENAERISKAKGYADYRELLALPGLDAVWIATPDHWHAKMTMDAMEAGVDVYCEKPMTRTWREARDVHRMRLRTNRVVQIGSQYASRQLFWKARELVQAGRLGKLIWSQASYSRNLRDGDWKYGVDHKAGPHNLDWDAFLGPAPKRPYDAERFFRWRKYWDYSGGITTDLFVHQLLPMAITLGCEFPVRAFGAGGVYLHKDRETPDTFLMTVEYPSEHTILIVGSQANEQGLPTVVRGHEATMYLSGNDIEIRPEQPYSEGRSPERVAVKEVGDSIVAHHANFLDCVRRKDPKTNCNTEVGYKVTVAVDLANRCWREGRAVRFDPVKEEEI